MAPITRGASMREQADVEEAMAASLVTVLAEPELQPHFDIAPAAVESRDDSQTLTLSSTETQSSSSIKDHAEDVDVGAEKSGIANDKMEVDGRIISITAATMSTSVEQEMVVEGVAIDPDVDCHAADPTAMILDSSADSSQNLSSNADVTVEAVAIAPSDKAIDSVRQEDNAVKRHGIDIFQQLFFRCPTPDPRGDEEERINGPRPEAKVLILKFLDKHAFGRKLSALSIIESTVNEQDTLKKESTVEDEDSHKDLRTQGKATLRKRKTDPAATETKTPRKRARKSKTRTYKVDDHQDIVKDEKDDNFVPWRSSRNTAEVDKGRRLRARDKNGFVKTPARASQSRGTSSQGRSSTVASRNIVVRTKRVRTNVAVQTRKRTRVNGRTTITETKLEVTADASGKVKKEKRVRVVFTNSYRFKFGHDPFPDFPRRSREQFYKIFEILREHHAKDDIKLERDAMPNGAASSDVPAHVSTGVTVDNFIRTIMSQSTSNGNALFAQQCLLRGYQYNVNGSKVKGTIPNYHDIRVGTHEELAEVLKAGGLHKLKTKYIKGCLDAIYQRNLAGVNGTQYEHEGNPPDANDFVPGLLSVDFLKDLPKQERFDRLVEYAGIAVKTACCILAFNYGLPVFAVDTHVWRLAKWLHWVPQNCSRDQACAHLDMHIPDEIKFALHQLFWHHGQRCKPCTGRYDEKSEAYKSTVCPLEKYMDRSAPKIRKAPIKKPKVKKIEGDDDVPKPQDTRKYIAGLSAEEAAARGLGYEEYEIEDAFQAARGNITGKAGIAYVIDKVAAAIGKPGAMEHIVADSE